jgi:flagellar hook protein FlgE
MSSSLLTAVSGLQAAQQMLDVTGNNLANVNTTGFKSQRADFQDLVYETLQASTLTTTGLISGTNPVQVGLGVTLGATTTDFGQGGLTATGRNLDLAIQGNGFFVVKNAAGENIFTRAGVFDMDSNGYLVDPSTGYRVQRFGTVGEATATTPAFQTPNNPNILIPIGTGINAQPTQNVQVQGNLSAAMAVGATYSTAIQVYDTQGTAHSLTVTFTKTAANTFSMNATVSDGTVSGVPVNNITFNADGSLAGPATAALSLAFPPGLPAAQPVNVKFGTVGGFDGLTQFGTNSSAATISQDGSTAGSLSSFTVAQDGTIQGTFTNGRILPIAQMALARFSNVGGLTRAGGNYYSDAINSGPPIIGAAGSGSFGLIQRGTLEQSNVNVSLEFTRLIVAQRAFQVNARTISTTDQMLQALVAI